MIDVIRAELATLTRRRLLIITTLIVLAFATIATLAVVLGAEPAAQGAPGRGATLESLAAPGGGTEAFSAGASFAGLFVLVAFAARLAGEFTHGTLRTVLMKEPRRLRVVIGKMLALVTFMASVLLVAGVWSFAVSALLAPGQDVDTAAWYSLDGVGAALGDYTPALAGLTAWACFGLTLALLLRSVGVAVAVGVAWAGPFEHLTDQALPAAGRWLPGLQLEALSAGGGGTSDISYQRALLLAVLYVTVAAAAALRGLVRRDVAT